jgi:hypothetical protein
MVVPASQFTEIFQNVKSEIFDWDSLSLLDSIESVEEMLILLEGMESLVLGSEKNVPSNAGKVIYYLLKNKLALFILMVNKFEKLQYINMLSTNIKYTTILDQSMRDESSLASLYEYFLDIYGATAVGIFAAFLKLPEKLTTEVIDNVLYRPVEGNKSREPFKDASSIYRVVCDNDENAVFRVVEYYCADKKILWSFAHPLSIIWYGLGVNDVPIVSTLFKSLPHWGKARLLEVTNSQQLLLFYEILKYPIQEDTNIFDVSLFPADFVEGFAEVENDRVQTSLVNHVKYLLENHIKNPTFRLGKSNDALLQSCRNGLTEEKKSNISFKIFTDLGGFIGPRYLKIVQFFARFITNDDFVKFLGSNVFSGPLDMSKFDFDFDAYEDVFERPVNREQKIYDELRSECFFSFFGDVDRKFTVDQRKAMMKFAVICGDSSIIIRFYELMALRYPLEARYMEDNLATCMIRNDWTIWKCVCHFTLKNRKKFFELSRSFVSRYITELGCPEDYYVIDQGASISALHRLCPRGGDSDLEVSWVQNSPCSYRKIFNKLSTYYRHLSREEYREFSSAFGELLKIQKASQISPRGDSNRIIDIVEHFNDKFRKYPEIFREVLASLMIRYKIKNEHVFNTLYPDPVLQTIYSLFVLSFPEYETMVDLTEKLRATYEYNNFDFYTILYFYDYYTDDTKQKLLTIAGAKDSEGPLKFASLAVRVRDVKKFDTDIARMICSYYFYDEVIDFVDVTEHPDLSETSKLQILAHWFFVDEFEGFSELASTVFFIGICASQS